MCLIVFCNAVFSQFTSKICTLIRFTLFSNKCPYTLTNRQVLLPYRFTLFSNGWRSYTQVKKFYYLIDLHYSQTHFDLYSRYFSFYYLIDLHYSQTNISYLRRWKKFYYLIDLHYSQTKVINCFLNARFYYLIDLHYSQTTNILNTNQSAFENSVNL